MSDWSSGVCSSDLTPTLAVSSIREMPSAIAGYDSEARAAALIFSTSLSTSKSRRSAIRESVSVAWILRAVSAARWAAAGLGGFSIPRAALRRLALRSSGLLQSIGSDRKRVVSGTSVEVRVDLRGRPLLHKITHTHKCDT